MHLSLKNAPEVLLKHKLLSSKPTIFNSLGIRQDLRICILSGFSGNAAFTGLGTTHQKLVPREFV